VQRSNKLTCPNCGVEMNQHAEKIDYSVAGPMDSEFGGVVEEVHGCPSCGKTEVRTAS
jgi:ribosomal protein S27AE